jgi:hypothetical protein
VHKPQQCEELVDLRACSGGTCAQLAASSNCSGGQHVLLSAQQACLMLGDHMRDQLQVYASADGVCCSVSSNAHVLCQCAMCISYLGCTVIYNQILHHLEPLQQQRVMHH